MASCDWQMVMMIPKGLGTDFRVIGLVEVLWKAISGIINFRISSSIQFHDAPHGFHTVRETGTATLKANLLQQLIAMREAVLRSIFLDLIKAYDALERELCLDILMGYGVRPRTLRMLQAYWSQIQMAENSGGHYRPVLQSHYGLTQG